MHGARSINPVRHLRRTLVQSPRPSLQCLSVEPARLPPSVHPMAGESEADHRELVDFCASFRFERMGAFQYSEEDGTPAAELPEQVWWGGVRVCE